MVQELTDQDWDRITFALSHFNHNIDYQDTLARVLAFLGRDR